MRQLSYSEVSTALDCQAKWDFGYGGHLAGDALKAKAVAPLLSGGRAWGAAVAAYHSAPADQGAAAIAAMDASLEADADRQREFGVHDQQQHDDLRLRLLGLLNHYADTADELHLEPVLERELIVPLPALNGSGRPSSRYRLVSYLDATRVVDGRTWLVEFKLRGRLTSALQIALSRQTRWYAWAYWKATGIKPAGVETIERLNEVPKPARLVKSRKKGEEMTPSHAKDQLTTTESYTALCREHGVPPKAEVLDALEARIWQQRVPIIFRDDELNGVEQELASAARLIHQLDTGALAPLRNPKNANCAGCGFRDVCANPEPDLVDALFERRPPKRHRREEQHERQAA